MEKYLYGKLLGEIYRIQRNLGMQSASDGRIFGLINGVEGAIDEELKEINERKIVQSKINAVCDYLDTYYKGEKSLNEMPKDLHVRLDLERKGVKEADLITILKYLKSNGRYEIEIDKLGNYNLSDFDL